MGIKKAKSLLSTAGDTDLLEQIVAVLCWNKEQVLVYAKEASHMKIPTTMLAGIEANSQVCEAEEGAVNTVGSIDAKSSEKSLFDIELRAKWFKAISGFDRFDLMVRFVSDALLANVVDILDATDSVYVSELKKKYCKTGRS